MNGERPNGSRLPGGRESIELWAGLALVAIGFVAVALGWARAAGTADVRVQLQVLISGGLGGLGIVVAGAFLVQAYLTNAGFRRLERQLDRVTGALLELAGSASPSSPPGEAAQSGPGADMHERLRDGSDRVLASHAAYHLADCDLLEGREDIRSMTFDQADREGLAACRVCVRERVV